MLTFRHKSEGNVYFHKVAFFAILHTSEKLIVFINKLHKIVWKPVKAIYAVDNECHVFQTYFIYSIIIIIFRNISFYYNARYNYSGTWLLRPPNGLVSSGLNSKVV